MAAAGGSHDTSAGLGNGPPPEYGCTTTLVGADAGMTGAAEAHAVFDTWDGTDQSLQPASLAALAATQ